MRLLNKKGLLTGLVGLGSFLALPVMAAADTSRIAAGQGEYLGSVVEIFILVMVSVMFLASLAIILIAGWFLIRDYVMKDEREKRFAFPQLIVAMMVAAILAFPTGGFLLGQDILTGNQGGDSEFKDFSRAEE